MGYTGVGLNQARAHVHLELNLMVTHQFRRMARRDVLKTSRTTTDFITASISPASISRGFTWLCAKDPALTIPEFIRREKTSYKVHIPEIRLLRVAEKLSLDGRVSGRIGNRILGSLIHALLVPIKIEPSEKHVVHPELTYIEKTKIDPLLLTQRHVTGQGKKPASPSPAGA